MFGNVISYGCKQEIQKEVTNMKKTLITILTIALIAVSTLFAADEQTIKLNTAVQPGADVKVWPTSGIGNKDAGYMISVEASTVKNITATPTAIDFSDINLTDLGLAPNKKGEFYFNFYYTGKEAKGTQHSVTFEVSDFTYGNYSNAITLNPAINNANEDIHVMVGANNSIKTNFAGKESMAAGKAVVNSHIGSYKLSWANNEELPVGDYSATVKITVSGN